MSKLPVQIPHIAWRDGRPRFTPGPRLRALGFKGEDLKNRAGAWLDPRAAEEWAGNKQKQIDKSIADAVAAKARINEAARRQPPQDRRKPRREIHPKDSTAGLAPEIPHIAWRDGRPRFTPGPRLRALGFKGEDLKNSAGAWLDARAAEEWARNKQNEIDRSTGDALAAKARKDAETAAAALAASEQLRRERLSVTVGCLFTKMFASKKLRSAGEDGCCSKVTRKVYYSKADAIRKFDPELWTSPAAALDRGIVKGLHEALWEEKGHAMANSVIAVLRAAYSHAQDAHPWLKNPCMKLGLPPVAPRLRVATFDEVDALLSVADATDPEIGDAIVLALFTGQRQSDVVALEARAVQGGKIRFIQSKTGARVRVRAVQLLVERLDSARMRRLTLQMKIQSGKNPKKVASTVVIDSHSGETFNLSTFRHRFATVREQAAKTLPSLSGLLFLDLRDTAVTWLANAGCTVPEIAAISGHSLQTVHSIWRHYLETNEEQADAAMNKLEAWMEAKGMKL